MSPKVLALLLLMLGIAFLTNQYRQKSANLSQELNPTLPSPTGNVAGAKTQDSTPPLVAPIATSKATVLKTASPIPKSENTNQPANTTIENFIYTNAKVNSKNTASARLQSEDSTNTITEWYKSKLNNLGYNVTSFITTNTNNNILNKLVASKNNKQSLSATQEVRVEIKKDASSAETTINIELK